MTEINGLIQAPVLGLERIGPFGLEALRIPMSASHPWLSVRFALVPWDVMTTQPLSAGSISATVLAGQRDSSLLKESVARALLHAVA